MLLDPLDRNEQRLGHFHTEEGDPECILNDIMHKLIVFGEGCGVDHRVDDEILQLIPNLLNDEQLNPRNVPVFGQA